jgi:hypothetical protein
MRLLLLLVIAAVVVYFLVSRYDRLRTTVEARRVTPALPQRGYGEFQESAALASGPDAGFGVLRLTPSQLIFAGASGRVLTIERLDIIGVTSTPDLPDRTTARPVLAVATADSVHYFAVDHPGDWEQRLTGRSDG